MRRVVYLALFWAAVLPAMTASAETMADKQLAQQVGSHLKQSGKLHNYRISVRCHDGIACLDGTVTSAEQRQAAVHLAQHVKGVSRVECKLEVAGDREASQETASKLAVREKSKPAAENDRSELAAALDRATQASAQSDAPNVRHAYQETSERAAMQPPRMLPGSNARMGGMRMARNNMPLPAQRMGGPMPMQQASPSGVYQAGGACAGCNGGPAMGPGMGGAGGGAVPVGFVPHGAGRGPSYDNASMPGYAWPSYASYPNYAALTYPQQYSPTAWPYIGPFYPYPQVPLAWRKVSLEWDDGWWFLDFSSHNTSH